MRSRKSPDSGAGMTSPPTHQNRPPRISIPDSAQHKSALAGALRDAHPEPGRLRVTLHRAITVGDQELLQQACDYLGADDEAGSASTAARTFPAENATIGLAYTCRRIVRSLRKVKPEDLKSAMGQLNLNAASRTMAGDVGFVLAIPILE